MCWWCLGVDGGMGGYVRGALESSFGFRLCPSNRPSRYASTRPSIYPRSYLDGRLHHLGHGWRVRDEGACR